MYYINLASTRGYFMRLANQKLQATKAKSDIVKLEIIRKKRENRDNLHTPKALNLQKNLLVIEVPDLSGTQTKKLEPPSLLEKLSHNFILKEAFYFCQEMKTELPIQNKKVLILGNRSYKNLGDDSFYSGQFAFCRSKEIRLLSLPIILNGSNHSSLSSLIWKQLALFMSFPRGFVQLFAISSLKRSKNSEAIAE